jgi:uncharacterized protein (TIGR04551 family)
MNRLAPAALAAALLALIPQVASAQTPGLPPPGGPTGGEEEPKPEGVAEKAPREPGQLPTTPTLPPWPGQKRKKFELFELDGYFRVRTDWMSNLNLGFHAKDGPGGTPFRESLTCLPLAPGNLEDTDCEGSVGSANMRLRLEPVINLSEQVSVHAQIDILDNLVLGSTPEGVFLDNSTPPPANIPINAFNGSQVPPEAGVNNRYDSIRVKRAWGEVKVPDVGVLRFGRMPSYWGLGLLANSGGYDAFRDTYCLDCDNGDNADRILFGTMIPGTPFRTAVAMDWASSEPSSAQTRFASNRQGGQPWDLTDADDVRQWVFVLAKLDAPEVWRDIIERGDLGLNYGVYFVYRTQDFETRGTFLDDNAPEMTIAHRGATAYIPDFYAHLGYKKLNIEAELVAIFGDIEEIPEFSLTSQDIWQLGGVFRLNYLMMDDDLNLGFEAGYASGDEWDQSLPGNTNVQDGTVVRNDSDHSINNFRFDFDYHVDLILFRELLGTVTNATYFKPTLAYNLTNRFIFRAQTVVSFANVPVATPGNGSMYGIELDGDLGYENKEEGFFAGVSYGVFFPLGAMDHPAELFPSGPVGDAETAQTFQTRLVLKF